jgi:hypothetical protein
MKPGFLIAGVAKSGTTSLFYYLDQHPEICIPKKETFYFIADKYEKQTANEKGRRDPSRILFTKEQYDALYTKCSTGISGEVSTCYVYYYQDAIPRIKEMLGDIPIIIILRQPVKRLISGYKYHLLLGIEDLPLEQALEKEEERQKEGYDFMWQYRRLGLYARAVKAYQDNFSRVKIILQEELDQQPTEVMHDLFRFIGVDENFKPDTSVKYNISDPQTKNLRFRIIAMIKPIIGGMIKMLISEKQRRKMMHKMRTNNQEESFRPNEHTIRGLKEYYAADIAALEKIIDRDLSSWK